MAKLQIDLNLDAGESVQALDDGSEFALYELVTSVNVACGGHAGDEDSMSRVAEQAAIRGLAIGAHPSFPDRRSFGRRALRMSRDALVDSLCAQMESLLAVLRKMNLKLNHVKPHGSLYNLAATDREYASAVIEAVRRIDSSLPIVGLAYSNFLKWCSKAGQTPIAEGFADRRYEPDGTLRDRQYADALILDPQTAGEHAKVLSLKGEVQTICIHTDTPGALQIACAVRTHLLDAGFEIRSIAKIQ